MGRRNASAWPAPWYAEPELLLLDEPFGALDALTRIRMHALVVRLCQKHHPAVLLVTHDVDEALLLADRVLVLSEGSLSLDLPVDLDAPRLRGAPEFARLRSRLLTELGVDESSEGAASASMSTAFRNQPTPEQEIVR